MVEGALLVILPYFLGADAFKLITDEGEGDRIMLRGIGFPDECAGEYIKEELYQWLDGRHPVTVVEWCTGMTYQTIPRRH